MAKRNRIQLVTIRFSYTILQSLYLGNNQVTKETDGSPDDIVEDYNNDMYASFYEDPKAYDGGGHFLDKLKKHLGLLVDFKSSKKGQEGIVMVIIMHIIWVFPKRKS